MYDRFLTVFAVLLLGITITASVHAQSTPGEGDLVINEIMYNPSGAGNEPGHEWFEVKNVSGLGVDINGCTISDGEGTHTIAASTTIADGGYFVLGYSDTITGVAVDYVYNGGPGNGANIQLANSGDDITIACGVTTIDTVTYNSGSGWPTSTDGTAISFGVPTGQTNYAALNDSGSNWRHSTSIIGGGNSDKGTPGAKNDDVLGATAITLSSFIARSRQYTLVGFVRHRPAVDLLGVALIAAAAGLTILKRRRPTQ